MQDNNPWLEIPLDDYEKHMSHATVGQLGLLSSLTNKYLTRIKPASCIFVGVAGGNGLEHINNEISRHIVGIDINQDYLDVAHKRHHNKIPSLLLLNLDVSKNTDTIFHSDLIWAALIMEYIGIDACLKFSANNLTPGGHLIVTIQCNNNLQSVSATGIESVKKAGSVFNAVDINLLLGKAKEMGFAYIGREENQLPNGKSFLTIDFTHPSIISL
jgi:predicted TPR repeat methyltransferase